MDEVDKENGWMDILDINSISEQFYCCEKLIMTEMFSFLISKHLILTYT